MDDFTAWMEAALEQARAAEGLGEVPVGAVLLRDGEIIARGHNTTEVDDDPTAHAEVNALRTAARLQGDWRLEGTTLVVTLEPCAMCMGAIALARVERLIYAATDPRLGACGSTLDLWNAGIAPHLREVQAGILEERSSDLLRSFFRDLRDEGNGDKAASRD